MLPLVLPDRKRLDQNAGFQQHIVGDIRQRQFGIEKAPAVPTEQTAMSASLPGRWFPRARLPKRIAPARSYRLATFATKACAARAVSVSISAGDPMTIAV
ncbi:MAG: hypothetical protein A3F74_14720 [Betaproteobacteria bacterium RIFCSPLOWO2_12_FULL_62_58]|nr:MAG: hypothetical protein A3F74_14720 [Betaproteobacteria bacterium RIFCSPLOWO2_12_FULL_62_58]